MPGKIPTASLAYMFIESRVARPLMTRWIVASPYFLIPGGLDARTALEQRGFFPWGERIFEKYRDEIEAAYEKSASALYLSLDPDRLVLVPVKVSGVEIDWERQVPESQEDPFYPSFEPVYVTPPDVIAPPPARVETTEPIIINPLIEEPRNALITHPKLYAAGKSVGKVLRTLPRNGKRGNVKITIIPFVLEPTPPIELKTILAYLHHDETNDYIREILTRHWPDIQAEIRAGNTAIGVLGKGFPKSLITAKPDARLEKEELMDDEFIIGVLTNAPVSFAQIIKQLLFRGDFQPPKEPLRPATTQGRPPTGGEGRLHQEKLPRFNHPARAEEAPGPAAGNCEQRRHPRRSRSWRSLHDHPPPLSNRANGKLGGRNIRAGAAGLEPALYDSRTPICQVRFINRH